MLVTPSFLKPGPLPGSLMARTAIHLPKAIRVCIQYETKAIMLL